MIFPTSCFQPIIHRNICKYVSILDIYVYILRRYAYNDSILNNKLSKHTFLLSIYS